jgi:hypothetical protein
MREDEDSLGCRVIHRISRRAGRRWKLLLKAMGVFEEKAARRNAIHRWIWNSMR